MAVERQPKKGAERPLTAVCYRLDFIGEKGLPWGKPFALVGQLIISTHYGLAKQSNDHREPHP